MKINMMATSLTILLTTSAMATTLVEQKFGDLVSGADGVVVGTVSDIQAHKGADGVIYSFVSFDDLEIVRGSYNADTFTMRFEGGQLGNERQWVEGAPYLREGERVLMFVDGNGSEIVPLVGWSQGLFRIIDVPDEDSDVIVDALGNRVFGIRDQEIIKESRFGSEAEILGDDGGLGRSDDTAFYLGEVKGGDILTDDQPADSPIVSLDASVGGAISLQAFREEIGRAVQLGGLSEPGEALVSVTPGAVAARDASDGTAVAKDAEAIELLPAEREASPRQVMPGPEETDE